MATTETPDNRKENTDRPDAQVKTIFNILSKIKESELSNSTNEVVSQKTLEITEENEDIVILRRDPNTKRNTINKSAYLKLHRSLSPNRNSTIEKIKEQYEKNDKEGQASTEIDSNKKIETLETIKNKYSPAGLGYTKPQPAPRPRRSKLTRSQIILPSKKDPVRNARLSLNIEKNKHKDVNSNDLQTDKKNHSSDEEFISIVTRSDSEESIYKFQKELSAFTMDKKKRANSFRKIFSVFSNKDKKRKQEDKNKVLNKENGETYSDNFHNESNNFSRQTPYRHTTGGESKSLKSSNIAKVQKSESDVKIPNNYNDEQLERDYAQMHINQFNKFKQNFDNASNRNMVAHDGYTTMDKPIKISQGDNSSYMNIPAVRKYIDTSSSASTLDSDRSNLYHNEVLSRSSQNNPSREDVELRYYPSNSFRPSKVNDGRRDTPPRLLETQQDVRLVNPKALIPINSERPLPNPYQNGSKESFADLMTRSHPLSQSTPLHQGKSEEVARRPYLEETYGTVLDSLEDRHRAMKAQNKNNLSPKEFEKPPRSPSLEPSKLKLPPNRDIVHLSPRVRSPIPSENVSTDKMIATELLKPKRSPTPTKKGSKESSPSHQRLEIDIDYPDNVQYASKNSLLRSTDNLIYKPPVAAKPNIKKVSENSKISDGAYRISQALQNNVDNVTVRQRISQLSPIDNPDRIMANVQVHMNSPVNRTPTPNNSMQNLSLSPTRPPNIGIRPSTPSGSRIPESPKTTPQKEDIRKSVEAYYWKEIKKLKDQENQELYLLQMQYGNMFPFGYAEDPISVRRSRSISPSARNGRRSLSLPRDTRPPTNVLSEKYYPNAIPENRAVTNQIQPRSIQQLQFQQQQYFNRNMPERKTIDGSNTRNYENNTNSLYRPIFKRGSLNTPPSQAADDSLKRKVSFSGAQDLTVQSWPTKNGFTQSPPQRRIEKLQSQGDDDVFLPNTPKIVSDNRYRYSESNIRPDLPNEEMYYNTRQNIIGPNGEPMYLTRNNQHTLYLQQRQAAENPYGQRVNQSQRYLPNKPEEILYGMPIDAVQPTVIQGLTRHGSIQITEEMYGQRPTSRRISYQNNSLARPSVPSTPVPNQEVQYVARHPSSQQDVQPLRREIILNDEIFGQFGGYAGPNNSGRVMQNQNVYASRQSIADYNSRVRDQYYNRIPQRQVSVTNRVCDIYGKIHDSEPAKIQQSGMIMGQLHRSPGSPAVVRNSHSQLPGRENFVRNSRLTASANDMYRRVHNTNPQYTKDILYGKIEPTQVQNSNVAPNRPLPPVPQGKKGATKVAGRHNLVSDTESGSDASEVQRILNSSTKTKKRGIFGK